MQANLYDRILVTSSDDNLIEKSPEIGAIYPKDFPILIQKFKQNKISTERLASLVKRNETQDSTQSLAYQVAQDKIFRDKWNVFLKYVLGLLYGGSVQPLLIKFLKYPFTMMSDVDLLTLDPMQELEAVDLLSKAGFAFFQFRLLAHPLEITAHLIESSHINFPMIDLDFYPEPIWNRKIVCDSALIFSRRTILGKDDLRIFVPSSEDDLYLVGTHAHAHLNITLAEILHGLELINDEKNFDWKYLYNLARNYGCLDSIYLYLKTLHLYSQTFRNWPSFDEEIFHAYEESKVCRNVGSWFKKSYSDTIQFPVRIPVGLGCVRSSFYHCPVLLWHVPLSDSLNDFLSHYLALSAKLILGQT